MKILQILVVILAFNFLFVFGQNNKAVLTGKVYDQDKKVTSNVAITAKDLFGKVFKAISNQSGEYKFWLPFGTYNFEYRKYRFKRVVINNAELISKNKSIDINLEIGFCSDCNGDPFSEELINIRKPNEVDFSKPREKVSFLKGNVIDEFGNLIKNRLLKFRNIKKEEFQALTNEVGNYEIIIPVGNYKVVVELDEIDSLESKLKINKDESLNKKIIIKRNK